MGDCARLSEVVLGSMLPVADLEGEIRERLARVARLVSARQSTDLVQNQELSESGPRRFAWRLSRQVPRALPLHISFRHAPASEPGVSGVKEVAVAAPSELL